MKYFFAPLFLCFLWQAGFAQNIEVPPYQKYKTVPPVKLLLADSSGWQLKAHLDKKKPLLLILFSPECEHCKHETEELVKNIDKFKNIQIVMATVMQLSKMNEFTNRYNLNNYKNITVGKDYSYMLPVYYDIKSLPYHAFYDKNKKLITGFEGTMPVEKILKQFDIK